MIEGVPAPRSLLAPIVLLAAACGFESTGVATTAEVADVGGGSSGDVEDPSDTSSADPSLAESSEGSIDEGGSTGAPTDDGVEPDLCPRVQVDVKAGSSLNVREAPNTIGEPIAELPNNGIVDRIADANGEAIDGNALWYQIASDDYDVMGYVFSGYVTCTMEVSPDLFPPDGYYLPLECGTTATISQGNDGDFSHQGNAFYAFDFSIGIGTPLVAMADGIVIHRYADTMPGDPCYNGGDADCFPYANLVVLLHGDGQASIYKHLSEVLVSDGEFVPRGTAIGLSGSTGYSTGPHAHVMLEEDCGEANCQSVPLEFVEIGVPVTDQDVTSTNCP